MAMSTTTTRTTRIVSPRLYRFVRVRVCSSAYLEDDERQGTETPAERQNNSPVMVEPCEVAICQHRAPSYSYEEDVISFDALWESALKCCQNVMWKPSVKAFMNNLAFEILRMATLLANGRWKNCRPHEIIIQYPKRRNGLSIRFPDRVYQRSINDNVLYPEMVRHFVIGNCACQRGKGPDFARMLLKKYLWNFYIKYGTEGFVLQIDIKSYYATMQHEKVNECFREYIPWEIEQHIEEILDQQYVGPIGYNPGSQMVQIAGISFLNHLDHYVKERLHQRYYIRYMDDFFVLGRTFEEMVMVLNEITAKLAALGLAVSPKKTHITPLSEGFRFLGFDYRMTETGKVIMTVRSDSVKHERKKLYRLVMKVQREEITVEKADECYGAWRAHAEHGDSYQLLAELDKYYRDLKWRAGLYAA